MPVDVYQECWPAPPAMERALLELFEATLAKIQAGSFVPKKEMGHAE